MSRTQEKRSRSPPSVVPRSKQYDLFTSFYGDERELSNTIAIWDSIPRFSVSRRKQSAMRDENGRLPIYKKAFTAPGPGGREALRCRLRIQPILVEGADGVYRDFYPSHTEELIEEVLKKIFADQAHGLHLVGAKESESWVRFSRSQIRRELRRLGHSRSDQEIAQSLKLLARCPLVVEVQSEDGEKGVIYESSILQDLTQSTRGDFEADSSSRCAARLPALISESINSLAYRQYNYALHMRLSSPLARWLHKRLTNHYRNASPLDSYHFRLSTIDAAGAPFSRVETRKRVGEIADALKELTSDECRVLDRFSVERRKDGREIVDAVFEVWSSIEFRSEVKATNKRLKDARTQLSSA